MATLVLEGFESSNEHHVSSSGVTVVSTPVNSGSYAIRSNPAGTGVAYENFQGWSATGARAVFDSADVYVRFYVRIATAPSASEEICSIQTGLGGTTKLAARLNSSRQIEVYNTTPTLVGTSSTALALNQWYCVELRGSTGASSSWELRINETSEASGTTNQTTVNAAVVTLGKLTNRNGSGYDVYFDDLLVSNSAFPGAGATAGLHPRADGTYNAWSAGAGANNYTDLDDWKSNGAQDGDTTYRQTSTLNSRMSVLCDTTTTAGVTGTITAVVTHFNARDNGNTVSFRVGLRANGTDAYATAFDNLGSYQNLGQIYDTANGTGWTTSLVDSAEPIIQHQQSQARQLRCSTMSMQVAYVPPSSGPQTATVPVVSANANTTAPARTATVTVSVPTPSANATATAPTASLITTAVVPTVSANAAATAPSVTASVSVSATAPSANANATAPTASTTGGNQTATVTTPAANANAITPTVVATVTQAATTPAANATTTAPSVIATVTRAVTTPAANANSIAPAVIATVTRTVTTPAANANATAPTSVPGSITVTVPVVTANATTVVPVASVAGFTTVPAVAANANAIAPSVATTVTRTVTVPAANANAIAPTASTSITRTVTTPAANASATPPTIVATVTQSVPVITATATVTAATVTASITRSVTAPAATATQSTPGVSATVVLTTPTAAVSALATAPLVLSPTDGIPVLSLAADHAALSVSASSRSHQYTANRLSLQYTADEAYMALTAE